MISSRRSLRSRPSFRRPRARRPHRSIPWRSRKPTPEPTLLAPPLANGLPGTACFVWLTAMIASPGETPAAPPLPVEEGEEPPEPEKPLSVLTLNGFSFGHPGIAELISRLATVPELTQVTLVESIAVDIEEENVLQFTVVARVKAPGGSTT